jgi:hypothetical protein
MYFKIYIPAALWGIVLVAILILVAHGGLYLFDRWYKKKVVKYDNEVTGIILGTLSLIYSLLIAFVIVAVWENYEELNRTIEKETEHLNSVLVHGGMLPDSLKPHICEAIKNYCEKVVNQEWDVLESQERFEQSAIPSLRILLLKVEANSKVQEHVLSILDNSLVDITNLRRERLSHTRSYVPQLVWMILIISSVMVITFSYFLSIGPELLRKIFLTFLWGIIGLSLFLVYMLDHPFVGSTQVSKESYEEIIRSLSG